MTQPSYPKPDEIFVAVDLVVLTIVDGLLSVLLVERGIEPFDGRKALPGGFVLPGEDSEQAALRELEEETGVGPGAVIWNSWQVTAIPTVTPGSGWCRWPTWRWCENCPRWLADPTLPRRQWNRWNRSFGLDARSRWHSTISES